MNTYPGHHGFGELDRRSRIPDSMAVVDALGSAVTATVYCLISGMDGIHSRVDSGTARESRNGDGKTGVGGGTCG